MTDEQLGEIDEIRLSSTSVRVPWEKRKELMRRLEGAGMKGAVEHLRPHQGLTGTDQLGVLRVLNDWLTEVKAEAFGEQLENLRRELEKDVAGRS